MKFVLILFSFSFLNPVLAGSIHSAAEDGDLVAIQQLLQAGKVEDINEKNFRGYSPLHYASKHERPFIVEFLLKNGADIDLTSPFGFTPLHLASKHGSVKVASILIQYGAYVNAKLSRDYYTPLHLASKYGHLEVAIMLVENGADINAKSIFERVAALGVYAAVGLGGSVIINENTPLDLAIQNGNASVAKYLESKGAVD